MDQSTEEVIAKPITAQLKEKADSVVKKHAIFATGAGLIPVLGLDVAMLTAIQTRMVTSLAGIYGLDHKPHLVRSVLTALVSSIIARLTAYGARKTTNSFSQFGKLADSMTNAAVAGFFTAAIGEIYHRHFINGGNLEDMDLGNYVDYLVEQITSGELSPSTFKGVKSGFQFLLK